MMFPICIYGWGRYPLTSVEKRSDSAFEKWNCLSNHILFTIFYNIISFLAQMLQVLALEKHFCISPLQCLKLLKEKCQDWKGKSLNTLTRWQIKRVGCLPLYDLELDPFKCWPAQFEVRGIRGTADPCESGPGGAIWCPCLWSLNHLCLHTLVSCLSEAVWSHILIHTYSHTSRSDITRKY